MARRRDPPKKSSAPDRSDPLLTAGLALAAGGVPLVFSTGLVSNFALPKLAAVCAAVLLCAGSSVFARGGAGPKPGPTALDLPLLAAALALAASAFFSEDRLLSVLGDYNDFTYGLWPLSLCAALFFYAAWAGEAARKTVLPLCCAAAGLTGAYAVLQKAGGDPFGLEAFLPNGRAIGASGNPVSLGALLATVWPLTLHQALAKPGAGTWACAAAVAAGLLLSVTRGAWLSAAAGTVFYLVLTGRLRLTRAKAAALLSAGALFAAALLQLAPRSHSAQSDSARAEIWRAAWTIFDQHPWLGVGPDAFDLGFMRVKSMAFVRAVGSAESSPHTHNDLLQALATTGVCGFLAYCWLLGALALKAAQPAADPRKPWAAALAAGLAALFLDLKVNPAPLETLAIASIFAGFLCAEEASGDRVWLLRGLAALAFVSAAVSIRLLQADRAAREGQVLLAEGRRDPALAAFGSAIRLLPCELTYRVQAVNILSAQAAGSGDPDERRRLLEAAQDHAEAARACHPNSPRPHFGLGAIALAQCRSGQPERLAAAETELDEALRLNPFFYPQVQARLQAALFRGDQRKASEMSARLALLNAPSPQTRPGAAPERGALRDP